MTRLFLLRHGATALNREVPYRIQGRRSDPPLDDHGRTQSIRTAEFLASQPIAAVYSGPLRRAVETAAFVAASHGLEPRVLPEITEADVGRWEGLTWREVHSREPEEHDRFMADPGTVPYPEGESFLDVQRRAAPALARLAASHEGQTIAVVAHNVVNRAVLADWLGIPIARAREIRQANGGVNLIDFHADRVYVAGMNWHLHLEGIEP